MKKLYFIISITFFFTIIRLPLYPNDNKIEVYKSTFDKRGNHDLLFFKNDTVIILLKRNGNLRAFSGVKDYNCLKNIPLRDIRIEVKSVSSNNDKTKFIVEKVFWDSPFIPDSSFQRLTEPQITYYNNKLNITYSEKLVESTMVDNKIIFPIPERIYKVLPEMPFNILDRTNLSSSKYINNISTYDTLHYDYARISFGNEHLFVNDIYIKPYETVVADIYFYPTIRIDYIQIDSLFLKKKISL